MVSDFALAVHGSGKRGATSANIALPFQARISGFNGGKILGGAGAVAPHPPA